MLHKGRVIIEGRHSVIDCTVRDLSEGGARIEFGAAYVPPPEFELQIPSKQLRVWARTVWSSGLRHGVMFFDRKAKHELAPLTSDVSFKVEQIVAEARHKIAEAAKINPDLVKLVLHLPTGTP